MAANLSVPAAKIKSKVRLSRVGFNADDENTVARFRLKVQKIDPIK